MKYYIGFDIGGTFVKGGIVSEEGNLIAMGQIPTAPDNIVRDLADFAESLRADALLSRSDIEGVGMGIPGMIDSDTGTVVFAGNLGWKSFPIAYEVSALTGYKVKITNDANAAALGEAKYGAGKNYQDSVLVTLGTGVGGGIIIGGKLFAGRHSQGAEIGHMVISKGGELCTCGRRGCFETYSSATALIRMTKKAMEDNLNSEMWKTYKLDTVNGKTVFDYKDTDESAKKVFKNYISYLSTGLANIANIFRPDVIMIGGGISNQKENLTVPLQKEFDKKLFGKGLGTAIPIVTASLGNKAGTLGAAAYAMEN